MAEKVVFCATCQAARTDDRLACSDISSVGARDLSSESAFYDPDFSGNLYVRVSIDLDNEFQLTFDVDWTFTDGCFYSADLDPSDVQEDFGLVDIRVGIGPADGVEK